MVAQSDGSTLPVVSEFDVQDSARATRRPDRHGDSRSRSVFVVHGRDLAASSAMFSFLRSIGLDPIEWPHAVAATGEASPHIGTVLEAAFSQARATVVLITPDEIVRLRDEFAGGDDDPESHPATQARPNVLFEAGMAMGRDPERTVIVQLGTTRPFSDIAGRHSIRVSREPEWRHELAERLKTAGCPVDTSGTDWLSEGVFTEPAIAAQPVSLALRADSIDSEVKRVKLSYYDGHNSGRLIVHNISSESLFDLNIELPYEIENFHILTDELPLDELPSGEDMTLIAVRIMGPGRSHFKLPVTYRTQNQDHVEEVPFLSLGG